MSCSVSSDNSNMGLKAPRAAQPSVLSPRGNLPVGTQSWPRGRPCMASDVLLHTGPVARASCDAVFLHSVIAVHSSAAHSLLQLPRHPSVPHSLTHELTGVHTGLGSLATRLQTPACLLCAHNWDSNVAVLGILVCKMEWPSFSTHSYCERSVR